jgi:hypothetical protein
MGVTSLDVATGFGGQGGGDSQRATLKKGEYFEANFLLIKTKLCLGGVSLQFCPRGTLFMIIGCSSLWLHHKIENKKTGLQQHFAALYCLRHHQQIPGRFPQKKLYTPNQVRAASTKG